MSNSEICFMTASEMVRRIKNKELSCREVMEAHLKQIDRVNPVVNAIVTRIPPEQALVLADAADDTLAKGGNTGPLHGLPMAHKDLVPTKDLRTTWGSPISSHTGSDDVFAAKLNADGALQWNTFMGSVFFELVFDLAVDDSGNVYIVEMAAPPGDHR